MCLNESPSEPCCNEPVDCPHWAKTFFRPISDKKKRQKLVAKRKQQQNHFVKKSGRFNFTVVYSTFTVEFCENSFVCFFVFTSFEIYSKCELFANFEVRILTLQISKCEFWLCEFQNFRLANLNNEFYFLDFRISTMNFIFFELRILTVNILFSSCKFQQWIPVVRTQLSGAKTYFSRCLISKSKTSKFELKTWITNIFFCNEETC